MFDPRRARPVLEFLEGRDVPAAYWIGDHSSDARDPRNYYPYNVAPTPYDNLYFHGPAATGNFNEDIDGDGEPDVRVPGGDCLGLAGNWGTVEVFNGYAGTITLGANPSSWVVGDPVPMPPTPTPFTGSGVTFQQLMLDAPDANLAQHHPLTGEVSPLTITGDIPWYETPLPASLTWYAGALNDTSVASTVTVTGTTALISTAASASVTLGSTLVFDEEAEAQVDGRVNLIHPTGIDVLAGSQLVFGPGTAIESAIQAIGERQTIRVFGTHSRLFTQGAATVRLGLWVGGGTAELQGSAIDNPLVFFTGPVRQANGAAPVPAIGYTNVSVYVSSGTLIIGEGAELATPERRVVIGGGKLATRVTAGIDQHVARILTDDLIVQNAASEVVIGDPTLNPPGFPGVFYTKLDVSGRVTWRAGTYRPLVDPNGTGSSQWIAGGDFEFGDEIFMGGPGPVLGPSTGPNQPLPPANNQYNIIRTDGGLRRFRVPTFEANNTNWTILLPPDGMPDNVLKIKRT